MTDDDKRADYIRGMRALMDALEAHPEIPLPYHGDMTPMALYFNGLGEPRRALAIAARAIPCQWAKHADEDREGQDSWLEMKGTLGALKLDLRAIRDDVCERKVIGTEEREVEKVVTPAVTEKVVETVEVVEWRCHPIMSALDEQEGQA